MSVGSVSNAASTSTYTGYEAPAAKTAEKAADTSKEVGAVYEKADAKKSSATYSINKMSAEDRAALVQQLKADQESRQSSFVNMVQQMMTGQAKTSGLATGSQDIWKFLASGNFTVDPATKAQAQADIAEDGYWGVKQTSQRLFDFASALAGNDVNKMKEMQDAMMKGYKQATAAWGKELPDISKQTIDAANKLFDDYYAAMKTEA